ncbi:hypothetical protein IEO70_10635 [Bacillus sp. AGMB 02131]|uniref:Uncharacterized protein n=1 Tax=Peribacillus faecalis TaxID=2772559 RepID=A0A927CWB5_9BACI|nr:hypothetical protein [Peribacillus faecalis]MBD3108823.1 hypothetical protein [Peribacillus faecalis]
MLDQQFLEELREYIAEYQSHLLESAKCENAIFSQCSMHDELILDDNLEDFIERKRKPTFQELLFQFIDQTGETDAAIYNRALIDRKLFSKIRSNNLYHPGKNTVLALALALKLNIENTDALLNAAGYSLSDSNTSDLIIQFCIEKNIYTIHNVNLALDHFDEKPL